MVRLRVQFRVGSAACRERTGLSFGWMSEGL